MLSKIQDAGGVNAHGVEVVSAALSIEPMGYDTSVMSFVSRNGFDWAGIDCVVEGGARTAVREGFAYYSGQSPARIPSSTNGRRRFVILDGTRNFEVLYSDNIFTASEENTIFSRIDAVTGENGSGEGLDYADWVEAQAIPELLAIPSDDADGDGASNLLEFFFGTKPLLAEGSPTLWTRSGAGYEFRFSEVKDREGVTWTLERSIALREWETFVPGEGAWSIEEEELVLRRVLTLSDESLAAFPSIYFRIRVELE